MYLHAWKKGLKTTYYLRSRPATRINKTTIETTPTPPTPGPGSPNYPTDANGPTTEPAPVSANGYTAEEAVSCSLENPESCEACT
jgi:ribonucleoside-diphosphate reductase alpha chain